MEALIAAAVLLPLALAALLILPNSRTLALALAPLAPLPALLLALSASDGLSLDLPWLLLGSRFILDDTARVFLGFTAVVWLICGWYARAYLAHDPRRHVFWAFFLITQAGNLGVCLAADAVSFYLLFAVMTFAAYGLVIHTGTAEARRAAGVYLIMALLGEAALVAGMLLAAGAAGSFLLADMAAAPVPVLAVWLLVMGFGVKVGVPLLHMWLPLAHSVAPVPASAVLSGVMLKAGLLGWLRFLPLGHTAMPEPGVVLMSVGLATAFLGVAAGLAQRDPKVLLAYSSVSQMGYATLGVGAGLASPQHWPMLLPAVTLYAVHHALAKSALFLGVGVARAHGGQTWVLAGLSLPALALAGAPLTSGMVVKLELKAALGGLPDPWNMLLDWMLPLAAVSTALLMVRLFLLLPAEAGHGQGTGLAPPWWGLVILGLGLPLLQGTALEAGTLWATIWPILLALILATLAVRLGLRAPTLPAGDLVVPLERLLPAPLWRRMKPTLPRMLE